MTGAEYLTPEVLGALWQELDAAFGIELAESKCGIQDFLKRRNPAWNLVGRVHFNLAENSKVRRQMGVEVLGVDLRPPAGGAGEFPILKLDAVREALPRADVAVSVCLVHHLRDEEFVEMIRNVGRACRRFVILDLVRHRVPLALFTAFAPLCLPRVNVLDGRQSIRRAYTPEEFRALIARAVSGPGGSFRHSVAPLWIRQTADIRY